jgi:hypothetical protein
MYARLNPVPPESLVDAIQRWMISAPTRLLRVLCWSGLLGALGVMTIDQAQWPFALGMIAMAAGGEWGLLEHRLTRSYSRPLLAAELIVATVALVATLVTIFIALFLFLGPAPHF